MDIFDKILNDGSITTSTFFVIVCVVCVYLWNKYDKYVKHTTENITKNYEIIREVKELVNENTKKIDASILAMEKQTSELEEKIERLSMSDIAERGELIALKTNLDTIRQYLDSIRIDLIRSNKR